MEAEGRFIDRIAAPVSGVAGLVGQVMGRLGFARAWGGNSLRSRVVRGSVWTLVGFGFGHTMSLVANLVLAWLLFREAFGLMALVRVVLQGLKMFSDVGIGPSIIQNKRGEDPAFLNTAWTIQIIRGVLLWLATCVLAYPAAWYFGEPELAPLLAVAGLTSLIAGFNSPAMFTANRKLALGRVTMIGVVSMFAGVAISIVAAWLTRSVWSLVAGWIGAALVMLVMSHTVLPQERVRLQWERAAAGQMYRFGRWIFVSTVITFFAREADKLLLGTWLGIGMFGVYSISVSVLSVPTAVCGQLAAGVLFPVLSEHGRQDPSLMGDKLKAARGIVLPVCVLIVTGVVCGAPILFGVLYHEQYADAAWIAQLLAIPTWFTLLSLSADRAIPALGDNKWLALSNLLKLCATAAAGYYGFRSGGLPGFIVAMTVGTLVGHAVVQAALARNGVGIIGQDMRFTLAAAVVAGAGAVLPRLAAGGVTATPDPVVQALVAAAILLPLGAWVLVRVKRRVIDR